MKRSVVALLALCAAVGGVAAASRTARIRGARVIQSSNEPFPVAEIALTYTNGPRPARVIVDVRGESSGSATLEGEDDTAHVVLNGPLGATPQIEVTTSTRVLGRLRVQHAVFAGKAER